MSALGVALSVLIGVSLGFFGGGGSILTVPLLVYVFGLEPKQAIASSLLIVAVASVSGAFQHWRAGNLRFRTGLLFGSAGMLGAYLGGRAAVFVDGAILLLLFAGMMVLTALAMWRGRAAGASDGADERIGRLLTQGLAVGLFTGLVGAGGGFLIVPALALWAGLPMQAAVGTSLFIIVLKSSAGFLGYQSHVSVDFSLVAVVSAGAVAGSFVGARLVRVVAPARLRRAFAGFVLAMACAILLGEGTTVVRSLGTALPNTLPQLAFAVAMLGLGVLTGRASRGASRVDPEHVAYEEGGGI